jgi:hypothetical protein
MNLLPPKIGTGDVENKVNAGLIAHTELVGAITLLLTHAPLHLTVVRMMTVLEIANGTDLQPQLYLK